MITREDLKGGAKRYATMPSHEREQVDRKMESITRECVQHQEQKIRDGKSMIAALSHEAAGYCHKVIVNGAVTIVTPATIGGNEVMERTLTEQERKIEGIVRSIKYDLTVEAACILLESFLTKGAENVKE